tara:strand:- start:317 stop:469 length:153 start_codon:yes stop_codon:yes gene_type:complete
MHIPNQVNAENNLDFYLNDFNNKSNEAKLILKNIESEIKLGIKEKFVQGR